MYQCYICLALVSTIDAFRVHLDRHRIAGQPHVPIMCRQGRCKSSCTKLFNFMRHVKMYHLADNENVAGSDTNIDVGVVMNVECDTPTDGCEVVVNDDDSLVDFLEDIQTEAVSLVAGLRANSSIPYGIIPNIVESFNTMANSFCSLIQNECVSVLLNAGLDRSTANQLTCDLEQKLQQYQNPLNFLSNRYRINTFFAGHPLAVMPETVQFGVRFDSHGGSSNLACDSFKYVSVKQTLSCLLQNKLYVEALLKNKCIPGVYSDCADGSRCKEHYLYGDSSKFSTMLQVFYDGLGVTNPLRSHGSVHNVGVFYFTVKNLPTEFNSCFGNVCLLALCYTHDISVYGYDAIIDKFVGEINDLSSVGFNGVFQF